MSEREWQPEELYPMLRAENAEVVIHPDDRKYGALLVGGQGTGKTSALLAFYINDIEDPNAAPIVMDPKTELSRVCLRATPPDCQKKLWFLDLGRPAFGMNPLIRAGERSLALEAAEIADNVVNSLLDVYEDQIFASSRRYLYHAVIGALALAERDGHRPTFEHMHRLLEPGDHELRISAAQACSDIPDLDYTAHFLQTELPQELQIAGSQTAVRMDAPRNKIATLIQAAPIRRFFHHPTNVTLRQIIEARDILIVDCAQAQVGDDNVRPMLMFMLRLLHRQMQRQVTLPEDERPRVPLLIDEAHYIANSENVVDQIATHRRAGLEPAFGLQYFAQLGSGSQHEEKIRKGVLNLMQSRFLFRMGDANDAEEATRIAMAVYATMIRDDPESRARARVTPDQALNFPNHYCLASWISGGTRIPSFMGQTYPLSDGGEEWAEYHLKAQDGRVGPYPETLTPTFKDAHAGADGELDLAAGNGHGVTAAVLFRREYIDVPDKEEDDASRLGAELNPKNKRWFIPAGHDPTPFDRWRPPKADAQPEPEPQAPAPAATNGHQPGTNGHHDHAPSPAPGAIPKPPTAERTQKREVKVDYEAPAELPKLDDSPIRRFVGRRVPGATPENTDAIAPDSLRDLAFLDRINEIGPADQLQTAASLPRLYDEDYAILALLDRVGLVPAALIRRAVLPDRTVRAVFARMTKLHRHGLVAQHQTGLRQHTGSDGRPPSLYSLTKRGMEIGQAQEPPVISRKREWRPIEQGRALRLGHDLHALAWSIELHHLVGGIATNNWRTPRYATGRYQVPQVGSGRHRHPLTLNEIELPYKQAIIDLELKQFAEIKPDVSLELRIPSIHLTFDLLLELDLTGRASHNRDKLVAYDAFLCGWSLAYPRYQTQQTRPAVVFACRDAQTALALAREADEAFTGRLGVMGTGPESWYHAGRDHAFFAVEADIHHGNLFALALPPHPPGLRQRLTGSRDLELERVALLPDKLVDQAARGARRNPSRDG
jgi:hypothetical protein